MKPGNFFAELKRRNVYKVAIAYAVVTWLLIQIATQTFPFFEIPSWGVRLVVALLLIGFPIALILAWAYELTPEGIKRTEDVDPRKSIRRLTGRKLDFVIITVLLVVIAGLLFQRYFPPRGRSEPPERSVAVLPLENLSKDEENAFFADGILDDILSSLSKIKELKVIRRTSVMAYRNPATRNLREIGRALGVANVLEGSVRRVGNRVLVNVDLVDVRNDQQLWSERYDRTLADALTLQGEVATEIASALRATLSPQEKSRVEAKPTNNPDAYVLYLRARDREQGVDPTTEDAIAAEQLYAQAIALDPTFALAHARVSMTNSNIFLQSRDQARKSKARAQAEDALRLSPTLGEAHLALGLCLYFAEKDYAAALEQFSIAEKTSPNNAEILNHSAFIYRRQGRWREALASFEHAQNLDPRNAVVARRLAATRLMVRDWPAAAADFNRALEIAPKSVSPTVYLAYLEFVRTGNPAAAKAILSKIPAGVEPDGFVALTSWVLSMLQRDFATAEKILDGFPLEQFFPGQVMDPKSFYQACTALARGDVGLAQRLFEKARLIFEAEVRDHPDDGRRHAYLGLLYACLDRKEDAIRESRRAVELEPESKDAYHGALIASNLALVYARTGEADQAIALIERLLSTAGAAELGSPASITLAELRLGWQWDPLRTNPRFQKILAGPEPKTIYQ
jgi:TolB-like protein/Flp pilus assembly protein TadD